MLEFVVAVVAVVAFVFAAAAVLADALLSLAFMDLAIS